jgi:hypothetical protein
MKKSKVTIGKINRRKGKEFENKVKKYLEEQGFMVIRFDKQVDLKENKLITSKPKFNPFTKRIMVMSSGFPDFICFKREKDFNKIIFVECKINGYLNKEEKEKASWLIYTFNFEFFVAKKDEKEIKLVKIINLKW